LFFIGACLYWVPSMLPNNFLRRDFIRDSKNSAVYSKLLKPCLKWDNSSHHVQAIGSHVNRGKSNSPNWWTMNSFQEKFVGLTVYLLKEDECRMRKTKMFFGVESLFEPCSGVKSLLTAIRNRNIQRKL
jgi:hypothetical protein